MSPQVGEMIREARQARGISLRQLARQAGIHFSHLSKIENGKDSIGRDTLCTIAELLGADADLLLGEAGHQSAPFRVLGDIAAGTPAEAIENVETFDLTKVFAPHDHFLLRVKGDSMILDGIDHGDMAIVRHTTVARNGETVVAVVDGEATLKRFRKQGRHVILIPANERLSEKCYPASQIEIRGVLVGLIRTKIAGSS